jgi:uncharacterized membrane protein
LADILYFCGTYLVVASSWISHYRIITYLRASNNLFVLLNVVFLGSIVFLPIPVALFYHYRNDAGVWQLFAGTQAVTSLTLLLLWIIARADQLLDADTPAEYLRYLTARLLIVVSGTVLSFAVAFFNVLLAEAIFLLLFIVGWSLHGYMYRRRRGAGHLAGTVRMCSITDNMTAVALTFLVTTITAALAANSHQSFSQTLAAVGNALPVYGVTFLIVGFYWLAHHRLFMLIRRHTMTLIWLNFAFLVFIELQPSFNALRSTYPHSQLTAALYAANQALTGLMLLVIWAYAAQRHRLIDQAMDRAQTIAIARRALIMPLLFLLSIALVFYRDSYAFPLWLLVIAVEIAGELTRRLRRGSFQTDGTRAAS